jgi:hypothetical protein
VHDKKLGVAMLIGSNTPLRALRRVVSFLVRSLEFGVHRLRCHDLCQAVLHSCKPLGWKSIMGSFFCISKHSILLRFLLYTVISKVVTFTPPTFTWSTCSLISLNFMQKELTEHPCIVPELSLSTGCETQIFLPKLSHLYQSEEGSTLLHCCAGTC